MSWVLRHAVLPPAIAYVIAMIVLVSGSRQGRERAARRRRPPLWRAVAGLIALSAGGYGAFALTVGAYCVAQTSPGRCLAPALREAGLLGLLSLGGLVLLDALSRLGSLRGQPGGREPVNRT
ncbi:MAG TPA: hypothetical protein VNE62_05565 [Actinomycetota bacterium]|nr:hypothetical protein [Actinomycetota bacterium]